MATSVAATISGGGNATQIDGMILETPFLSVKDMLISLYPQKWLPYRYLGPFLWNFWDSKTALQKLAASKKSKPEILVLVAGKDEVVPLDQPQELLALCKRLAYDVTCREIPNALHTETMAKVEAVGEVQGFLRRISSGKPK